MNTNLATDASPDERTAVKEQIKRLIVDSLHLEDVRPEQIGDDALLFSKDDGGLGLDSLNALEVLTAIEFQFKVRFGGDDSIKQHFKSVTTLATFVLSASAAKPR